MISYSDLWEGEYYMNKYGYMFGCFQHPVAYIPSLHDDLVQKSPPSSGSMSVNYPTTRHYIPAHSTLHSHRWEYLKSNTLSVYTGHTCRILRGFIRQIRLLPSNGPLLHEYFLRVLLWYIPSSEFFYFEWHHRYEVKMSVVFSSETCT
jgi:hypothetical protein